MAGIFFGKLSSRQPPSEREMDPFEERVPVLTRLRQEVAVLFKNKASIPSRESQPSAVPTGVIRATRVVARKSLARQAVIEEPDSPLIQQPIAFPSCFSVHSADQAFDWGMAYANYEGTHHKQRAVVHFRRAAESGHVKSQFELGMRLATGLGVGKHEAEAVNWFTKAALKGHSEAQFKLAEMFLNGLGTARNPKEAAKWYKSAASQGHHLALLKTQELPTPPEVDPEPELSSPPTQSPDRSQQRLAPQVDSGPVARTTTPLGSFIERDRHRSQQPSHLRKEASRDSRAGSPTPQAAAERKEVIKEVEDRHEQSRQILPESEVKTSAAGSPQTRPEMVHISSVSQARPHATPLTLSSLPKKVKDKDKLRQAARRVETAANKEQLEAQFQTGINYAQGRGVAQDDACAIEWFTKAALRGHAGAQFNLAMMLEEGRGIRQDIRRAIKWYRMAADQGHSLAQAVLQMLEHPHSPRSGGSPEPFDSSSPPRKVFRSRSFTVTPARHELIKTGLPRNGRKLRQRHDLHLDPAETPEVPLGPHRPSSPELESQHAETPTEVVQVSRTAASKTLARRKETEVKERHGESRQMRPEDIEKVQALPPADRVQKVVDVVEWMEPFLMELSQNAVCFERMFKRDAAKCSKDSELAFIRKEEQLDTYHLFFARLLTGTWLACMSINSSWVSNGKKFYSDYAGEALKHVGESISKITELPGIGWAATILDKIIWVVNYPDKVRFVQKLSALYPDPITAMKNLGKLSRQVTISKMGTIKEMKPPKDWKKKVNKMFLNAKAKITCDDVNNDLTRQACEDVELLFAAIRDDKLQRSPTVPQMLSVIMGEGFVYHPPAKSKPAATAHSVFAPPPAAPTPADAAAEIPRPLTPTLEQFTQLEQRLAAMEKEKKKLQSLLEKHSRVINLINDTSPEDLSSPAGSSGSQEQLQLRVGAAAGVGIGLAIHLAQRISVLEERQRTRERESALEREQHEISSRCIRKLSDDGEHGPRAQLLKRE